MPRGRPAKRLPSQEHTSKIGNEEVPHKESQSNGHSTGMTKVKSELNNDTYRSSGRQVRKRVTESNPSEESLTKHHRQCEKAGCNDTVPICFASANDRCTGRGYTSRWYHMSLGEHFCNECFDHYYRSHKEGYQEFSEWKRIWSSHGRLEASLKAFMSDQALPYWTQCTLCTKWRQLYKDTKLDSEFLENFKCGNSKLHSKNASNACQMPEDSRVQTVYEPFWLSYLQVPALLKNSPASQYLQEYYADGVGLSPTSHSLDLTIQKPSNTSFLQPFYQPSEQRKALCLRPDVMEPDEVIEFPEFFKDQITYLGIRNLIVALWNQNPKEWLTMKSVSTHLIYRGLARIRYMKEAERVLTFLTIKGIVNCGIITSPKGFSLIPSNDQESVVIVGAGPAGLAAAKHLHNLGVKVIVLEANKRIGGRVWDETSFGGACIGRGAQIVTGVINNLVSVMCEQLGLQMQVIGEKCELYNEKGSLVNSDSDQRVDFHFNAMLDSVAEWRKSQENDVDLHTKMTEMHEFFLEETGIRFSEEERNLLQFHMSNLEYACGCSLKQVSSLHWDQNEQFPQFAGPHSILPFGYGSLLQGLAQDLDIRLNHQVISVDYSQLKEVIMTTNNGKVFIAKKIIVTVPLAILQKGDIHFEPPLPEKYSSALKQLGSGVIEKVALVFPKRFWEKKLKDSDFFGHIPSTSTVRGLFSIFYDLTPSKQTRKKDSKYILMSYVSGDAVQLIRDKSDEEVVELCMSVLKQMFTSEVTVPQPSSWFVTHWHKEPFSQMAYSYIKVGGTGDAYDHMAQDINSRIYFAGEATNRQFPQTVSGALLSGIREAWKIISKMCSENTEESV